MKKITNLGQFALEYAVLIIIVVAALLAMRVFMSRAVQERYRVSADVFGQGEQYAKGVTKVTDLDGPTLTVSPPPEKGPPCALVCNSAKVTKEEIKTVEAKIKNLEDQVKLLKEQIEMLEYILQQGEGGAEDDYRRSEEIKRQINELDGRVVILGRELKNLENLLRVTKDIRERAAILTRMNQVRIEINQLIAQIKELTRRGQRVGSGKDELVDREKDEAIVKKMELQRKVEACAPEIEYLKGRVKEYKEQLDKLKNKYPDCSC